VIGSYAADWPNIIGAGQSNIIIGTSASLAGAGASNYLNIGNVIQGDMATLDRSLCPLIR
jgi:hypothetical protein